MDKLDKAREEICKDCMFGIAIENCKACIYDTFKKEEKKADYDEDDYDWYDPMLFDRMFTD